MKTSTKIKVLSVIISFLLLGGVFLLQKSKSDKSPDSVSSLSSNQEKPQIRNIKTPAKQESKVESIKSTGETLSCVMKPASSVKTDENLTASFEDFDDFVVDELGDELRRQLGRNVFEMEAVELTDHPESVVIEFKPEIGSINGYEVFSKACDENGDILQEGRAITSAVGKWQYEVISVDEDSYTVKESIKGEFVQAGKNFNVSVQKMPPIFEKIFTYRKDGSLIKAEHNGRDVTSLFKPLLRLVFPKKDLSIGDKWKCGGEPDSSWEIEAGIDGFARISEHNCVVVSFKEHADIRQRKELGEIQPTGVTRHGKYYYDSVTMVLVRKEWMETIEGNLGSGVNQMSSYSVMNLAEK